MIKLVKIDNRLYSEWSKHEGKSSGVFLTHKEFSELRQGVSKSELEQREREAFASGRVLISNRLYPNSIEYLHETFNDYLKQRNREQALSELVADGEKNGDYDDHLKQRKES